MSDFDIFLDSDNELKFSIEIEGVAQASVRSQFIIEGPRGIDLGFQGKASSGEVTVEVPTLKGVLSEGTYRTRLEVFVDDRIFVPLRLEALIKPTVRVEAAVRTAQRATSPVVKATVISQPKEPLLAESAPVPATPDVPVTPPAPEAKKPASFSRPPVSSASRVKPIKERSARSLRLEELLDSLDRS